MKKLWKLFCGLLLTNSSCSPEAPENNTSPSPSGYTMPYRLHEPDTVFTLPYELREISGLSMAPDGRQVLAVNDETGLIFYLNAETGAVERTRAFGKHGDYEGIDAVGSDVYVVSSGGTVFRIPESGDTEPYPTPLNADYDVEGLGYDPAQHRLLLACKGRAGKADSLHHKKAIYAFDLKTHQLGNKPAYLINRDEIARWKGGTPGFMEKVFSFFSTDNSAAAFGPSGIACCPADSMLYVIASAGKTLAILHPDGRVAHVERLNPDLFRQPEGICFDREGRLFIATEGKKQAGQILRFLPSR